MSMEGGRTFLVHSFISPSLSVLPPSSPHPQTLELCRYLNFLVCDTVDNPLAGTPLEANEQI